MIRGMFRALLIGGIATSIAVTAVGCIAVSGNDNQPTRGQELIDLKTALERGAITQAEYDQSKSAIVNRR